ncbi:MAG: hypothetical protein KDH96_03125 [Candidatus Riesia sp.]|nr:hypothetical protein [Candidatus Riesia sp.]
MAASSSRIPSSSYVLGASSSACQPQCNWCTQQQYGCDCIPKLNSCSGNQTPCGTGCCNQGYYCASCVHGAPNCQPL